jgi:hypothetical protein
MTEPPEPKPINNIRLRRFLFLALIKLLEHFRPQCGSDRLKFRGCPRDKVPYRLITA